MAAQRVKKTFGIIHLPLDSVLMHRYIKSEKVAAPFLALSACAIRPEFALEAFTIAAKMITNTYIFDADSTTSAAVLKPSTAAGTPQ